MRGCMVNFVKRGVRFGFVTRAVQSGTGFPVGYVVGDDNGNVAWRGPWCS